MDHKISVEYSIEIVRASVRTQWLNLVGTSGFVLLAFLSVMFIFLLISGERSWVFGFSLASLVIFAGFVTFAYFRLLSISMSRFRNMKTPTATFRFNDDGISVKADTGRTDIAWKLVEKILIKPELWILVVAGGGITLPTASLDPQLQEFILERISTGR